MGNLDVDFLFTNIPLEETDICLNTLFENMEKVGLSKIEFKKLLSLATKETHFLMLEVVGSSQKRGNFLLLFWLEPITSNIKLTMTSQSYKEFIKELITISEPKDLKLRPIVGGPKCPTRKLNNFSDLILKPLTKHVKSNITDNIEFLNTCKRNVTTDTFLVTFDVCSLYTNIPHEFGLRAI